MKSRDKTQDLTAIVGEVIERHSIIRSGDSVLAAVSGGLDSMVMLDLLAKLAPRMGFSLAVASLDHGMRGVQGQVECNFVASRAAELGLTFRAGQVDTSAHVSQTGLTVQEAARELRYTFLRQICARLGCNRLATAHHRDDQAETVLLRLFSGSGFSGLAGIRRVSEDGFLIRPLLDIPRERLEQYARAGSLVWVEDPSNVSLKYFRNRLRLNVIPAVEKQLDPSFRQHLALLANEVAELNDCLDQAASDYNARVIKSSDGGWPVLDCMMLNELPGLVRRRLVRRAVFKATEGAVILSGRPLAALETLAVSGESGRSLDLPGGIHAVREFDLLKIEHKAVAVNRMDVSQPPERTLPRHGKVRMNLGNAHWEIELEETAVLAGEFNPRREPGGLEEVFDSRALEWPLSVGVWRHGDCVKPFGFEGKKKLKKVFLEKRVPMVRRSRLPVIRDKHGKVLWVCSVARSNLAPVTPDTVCTVTLRAIELPSEAGGRANQH